MLLGKILRDRKNLWMFKDAICCLYKDVALGIKLSFAKFMKDTENLKVKFSQTRAQSFL